MRDWLDLAAGRRPDRVAIEHDSGSLTYAELRLAAAAVAGALGEAPLGTPVALELEDRLELTIALHACLASGRPALPVDMRLTEGERALRRARALVPVGRADVATVMHTSGTTSEPKPVELTYGNWRASALGSAVMLGLDLEERWLCAMPLVHVGGLSILIRSAIYATTVVLHERFDTAAVLAELMAPERRITVVSLVPTMLARLLDAGLERPPALRWALLGGGPIQPALLERAAAAGVPVAPTYGMTEACSQIATFGFALPGVELALCEGEILVRGEVVAPGALAADGWLHTGDSGVLDGAGRMSVVGRLADTIVSGGENIAPAEVEAVLGSHPAVADAGVYARADREWGEAVVACVVLRAGATVTPQELRAFCSARLAGFKVPREIELATELPRTPSGKLLRRQLAQRL